MSIKFFYNNYDLTENKVIKVEVKNNKLYLYLVMNAYLELIANGYRPEMDIDISNVFIFNTLNNDIIIDDIKDIYVSSHNDNEIVFMINNIEYKCYGEINVLYENYSY
jgi:hypothetical protein